MVGDHSFMHGEPLNGMIKPTGLSSSDSGKLAVLTSLLLSFHRESDKAVVVSNYTSSLSVIETLCKTLKIGTCSLDGSMNPKKRQQMISSFNLDSNTTSTVMLLSSKAGGCGLNIIGANRLVMFDADWNPANDKQAMARVWREGQKKICWIYRLFSTNTIEEKILQRQMNKEKLSTSVIGFDDAQLLQGISRSAMKHIFVYTSQSNSCDTHEMMRCKCLEGSILRNEQQDEQDLSTWAHFHGSTLRKTDILKICDASGHISFIMFNTGGASNIQFKTENADRKNFYLDNNSINM
jgi:DNA repair and recombination RAD54-like protein